MSVRRKGIEVIGLTGQTGAGKSTASTYFRERGCPVIDCDGISRQVSAPGSRCLAALTEAFSPAILTPERTLNRKALGGMVFGHPERLARLGEIIFPFILEELQRRIRSLERQGEPLVLLDAPTLFESGADRLCRRILAVTAPEEQRLARIMERDSLTREEALRRMGSQLPQAYFEEHADFVIENNGGSGELAEKLARALDWLREGRDTPA